MKSLTATASAIALAFPAMLALPNVASATDQQRSYEAQDSSRAGDGSEERAAPADHNTTRSNKTTPQASDGPDTVGGANATDYNSSRSNKHTASDVADGLDDDDDGEVEAQDDWSEPCLSTGVCHLATDTGDSETGEANATDYNSSRSNKRGAADVGDVDDDGDAEAETAERSRNPNSGG